MKGAFAATVVDRESVPQNDLDITMRVRTNLLPWKGQFSPQLIEQLLRTFAQKGSVVFDPFAGSGTTIVESARLGYSAGGCDINPAAVILSRVYELINLGHDKRTSVLDELRKCLYEVISGPLALTMRDGNQSLDRATIERRLVDIWHGSKSYEVRLLAAALVVLCDFHRSLLDETTVHKTWQRLEKTVLSLPHLDKPIFVHHADARTLPIEDMSIDLVVTSPPYINVHNYHQKYRRSVEAMGWNVLSNARSEIGSNRQNRSNRFLTVIQYSLDMTLALQEMNRVAKPGARFILVIGRESTVRGKQFFNGELVTELASQAVGLRFERRQERVFRNRFGKAIYEDILHFCSNGETPDSSYSIQEARRIAGSILRTAKTELSDTANSDISTALERLSEIGPSPIPTPELNSQVQQIGF